MSLICPKCGKKSVPGSRYYKKHVANCKGEINKSPKKSQKKDEISLIKKNLLAIEKRLSKLEDLLRKGNSDAFLGDGLENRQKFNTMNEFQQELMKIIQKNPKFKHIKRNYILKDIRNLFLREYKITEKEFEDNILRLYRKQIIDLQPGGNSSDYHISLPTGKKFYYLITKS